MKYLIILIVAVAATIVVAKPQGSGGQQRTPCIEHRERELRNNRQANLTLIPVCDENGNYAPKQCHPPATDGKRFCQCWSPTGDILSSPSKSTESCKCAIDRHEATNTGSTSGNSVGGNQRRMIGQFVPECERNGSFKKQQCHGSTGHCWCVDQLTGTQQGERIRGTVTCA